MNLLLLTLSPQYQHLYSPDYSPHISHGTSWDNLFINQYIYLPTLTHYASLTPADQKHRSHASRTISHA